jgi:FixJ family two-component response regulator
MMREAAPVVCLVDDDAAVRRGLQRLLRASGFQVVAFADAQQYLDSATVPDCNCLILDVRMPGIDGLQLQEKLRDHRCAAPIVFLTGHGDIPMSVQALKAGAADFLTKPVDEADLLAAVNEAVRQDRQRRAAAEAVEALQARVACLTPREHEIMRWVITGAMNKEIADRLSIAEKTVKIHRARVMQKLEVASVVELVELCRQAGIEAASAAP